MRFFDNGSSLAKRNDLLWERIYWLPLIWQFRKSRSFGSFVCIIGWGTIFAARFTPNCINLLVGQSSRWDNGILDDFRFSLNSVHRCWTFNFRFHFSTIYYGRVPYRQGIDLTTLGDSDSMLQDGFEPLKLLSLLSRCLISHPHLRIDSWPWTASPVSSLSTLFENWRNQGSIISIRVITHFFNFNSCRNGFHFHIIIFVLDKLCLLTFSARAY